jgi:hypothetical protein
MGGLCRWTLPPHRRFERLLSEQFRFDSWAVTCALQAAWPKVPARAKSGQRSPEPEHRGNTQTHDRNVPSAHNNTRIPDLLCVLCRTAPGDGTTRNADSAARRLVWSPCITMPDSKVVTVCRSCAGFIFQSPPDLTGHLLQAPGCRRGSVAVRFNATSWAQDSTHCRQINFIMQDTSSDHPRMDATLPIPQNGAQTAREGQARGVAVRCGVDRSGIVPALSLCAHP